jgi:putative transcriptional regulator
MIRHHPNEDLLLALAAGRLAAGPAAVVAAHLEQCTACRARAREMDALGGALLEQSEPVPMDDGALATVFRRIDGITRRPPLAAPRSVPSLPAIPGGARWPASLKGSEVAPWRWIGPGSRIARVRLPRDPGAILYLLCIAPGRGLPVHGHGEREMTQVLCGAFDDGRAAFGAGDFDSADAHVRHRPMAAGGQVCVCLAAVEGPLRFDTPLTAALARWACA